MIEPLQSLVVEGDQGRRSWSLFATIGLAPQVVTEACWALLVQEPAPIVPSEIVLLATRVGADLAQSLVGADGRIAQLYHEWGPGVEVPTISLRLISSGEAFEVHEDVDSNEAALAAGEVVLGSLASLTDDDRRGILALLSGGRKTMAYHVGLAFSLYARPWDRLLHVIVPPEYERAPAFFYPRREPSSIVNLDGVRLDASAKVVTLIDVPYVRLGMLSRVLSGGGDLALTVRAVNEALNPRLAYDERRHPAAFLWGGAPLELRPSSMLLLALLVRRVVSDDGWLRAPRERVREHALGKELVAIADALGLRIDRRTLRATQDGVDPSWLRPRLSRLNTELAEQTVGDLRSLAITSVGRAPRLYRINIHPAEVDEVLAERLASIDTSLLA